MASFEGIPSAFSVQPAARSSKISFYESLFLWNQGVDQVLTILRRFCPSLISAHCTVPRPRSKNFARASRKV